MKNSFRQVCDKPCASHPVLRAEWSPLRDLIAVLTANGEVRLHRMHWQSVDHSWEGSESHMFIMASLW